VTVEFQENSISEDELPPPPPLMGAFPGNLPDSHLGRVQQIRSGGMVEKVPSRLHTASKMKPKHKGGSQLTQILINPPQPVEKVGETDGV